MTLAELAGTRWAGSAELWEDPLGDVVQRCDCRLEIEKSALDYLWSYHGRPQQGRLRRGDRIWTFSDSWHQAEPTRCVVVPDSRALLCLCYAYAGDWGWRIAVSFREPTGEVVVQMSNIAPWGEEARRPHDLFESVSHS